MSRSIELKYKEAFPYQVSTTMPFPRTVTEYGEYSMMVVPDGETCECLSDFNGRSASHVINYGDTALDLMRAGF